jgi:hypothetical protein
MDNATAAQAPIEAPVSAPEGERVYVAVGINAWGKGSDAVTAKEQLARVLGCRKLRKSDRYVVKLLPVGAHSAIVDDFGSINWEGGNGGQCELIEDHKPTSRGRK